MFEPLMRFISVRGTLGEYMRKSEIWFVIIIVLAVIVGLALIIGGPFIINFAYIIGQNNEEAFVTMWSASDLLSYLGDIIAAVGTIFIGGIAFYQNESAKQINNRLMKLQEMNSTPFLNLDKMQTQVDVSNKKNIRIKLGLRNDTNQVINIKDISNLTIMGLNEKELSLKNEEGAKKTVSVLPKQMNQLYFSLKDTTIIEQLSREMKDVKKVCICELDITIVNVGDEDNFIEKFILYVNCMLRDSNVSLDVYHVECEFEKKQ